MGTKTPFENMEHLSVCPACAKRHGSTKALLLHSDQQRSMLHMTCANCHISMLVFVSFGQGGLLSFAVPTDLGKEEAQKVLSSSPISIDEVLKAHTVFTHKVGALKKK
ncbi:MAG TPA: hypothetical protein PKA31_03870 [Candidatus Moranbacteria bacterium]|nr:hypothetical protein [Candidatus Moranbacteria bacterium]